MKDYLILAIVLALIVFCCSLLDLFGVIRPINLGDANWNLRFRIEDGRIVDREGKVQGFFRDGKIYDRDWNLVGQIKKEEK